MGFGKLCILNVIINFLYKKNYFSTNVLYFKGSMYILMLNILLGLNIIIEK